MTAASGDPGEKPDYEGHPPGGPGVPPADPAYGGWDAAMSAPPAADYPPPYAPPAPGHPAGYAPPPYPPFPGSPPAYGGYPGYAPYPMSAQPATNVLAIVSLVSSVGGLLCFVGSLAGIVTGVIAISQIKRTGAKGYGLAVAGITAGVLGLLLYLVMVAYALRG